MKTLTSLLLLGGLLLAGCATSTVEKRKHERYGAYAELSAENKTAVDQGQIKVGMTMDAVYIAWGKPSQILKGESARGATVTWLYESTYLEEYRYWTRHGYGYGHGFYSSPHLAYDYYPRGYIRSEVVFENGVVREWRTLPAPPH